MYFRGRKASLSDLENNSPERRSIFMYEYSLDLNLPFTKTWRQNLWVHFRCEFSQVHLLFLYQVFLKAFYVSGVHMLSVNGSSQRINSWLTPWMTIRKGKWEFCVFGISLHFSEFSVSRQEWDAVPSDRMWIVSILNACLNAPVNQRAAPLSHRVNLPSQLWTTQSALCAR